MKSSSDAPRALSVSERAGHALSAARHQRARLDRQGAVVGLFPHAERGRDRALPPGAHRHARYRACRGRL